MIYLLILFILFISICLVFYMKTYKKIMRKNSEIDYYENYIFDFQRLLGDIKYCFEKDKDDSFDKIFGKEKIFKFNVLKYFILRGFYDKASFNQIFVVYDLLKKKYNEDEVTRLLYIDHWAVDVIKDIEKNLNVFTYCLYRYKIGRIFLILFHYLNILSLNCNIVRPRYNNYFYFIIDIPEYIRYVFGLVIEDKDSIKNFINFYQLPKTNPMSWYRKDFI